MKLLVMMLVSLAAVGASAALSLILANDLPDERSWLVYVSTGAILVLVITPVLTGATASERIFDPATPVGRKYLVRLVVVVSLTQLLGAMAFVVYSVLAGLVAWIPIAIVGSAAVLTVLAFRLGERVRKREAGSPVIDDRWQPLTAAQVARNYRVIVLTFTITFGVVTAAGFFFLADAKSEGGRDHVPSALLFGASFAAISAALACLVIAVPLISEFNGVFGQDLDRQKKVVRVVVRRKPVMLTESERQTAVKYASLFLVVYPFQALQSLLTMAGLSLSQLALILSGSKTVALSLVLIAFLALACLVLVPLTIHQLRNARRYLVEHQDDLRAALAAETP